MTAFAERVFHMIHKIFFASKEILTHKNRLDFIEIFYLLFSLKMIELSDCDSLSFTCKDAIDTGAVHSCEQYIFLKMMNDSSAWDSQEKELLYWMLYAPALMNRWRAVDLRAFNRMKEALSVIGAESEAHRNEVIAACAALFEVPFFKSLKIS